MSPALDPLSLKFVIWAQEAGAPALDVGCGEGIATHRKYARTTSINSPAPLALTASSVIDGCVTCVST